MAAARPKPEPNSDAEALRAHVTERLSATKRLLVDAYGALALTCEEAERIAARLRRRYPTSWRRA